VLRDWLGYVDLGDDRRVDAAREISEKLVEALDVRTSTIRADIPSNDDKPRIEQHRMRTRFAVSLGNQRFEDSGEARVESVSAAFNSPFWPFVLTSTSIGQEGLDFHLWSHAVVHWNLPTNPVDLEQREGRVHRYKGHAVRRNIGATIGLPSSWQGDLWEELFQLAAQRRTGELSEMVPYWVFNEGPAKVQRLVPVLPFSREEAALPRLRKALAAYRLAFGQPRQEELVEYLSTGRSDTEILELASKLRIDLSPASWASTHNAGAP
jgi:hypothetical protein